MTKPYHYPLPYQVRADLFLHLATMERAGMPALQAYATLRLPRAYQARLDSARKLMARGANPAFAGETSGLFTQLEAALLRAALAAGSPAQSYMRLADNYAQKVVQIRQVKSRLAMPAAVVVMGLLVQPLPALIAGTLSSGAYLLHVLHPLVVLALLGFLAWSLPQWFQRAEPGPVRAFVSGFLLKLPLLGSMHARRNARDFMESLTLLLEAGVPMFDALPVAQAAVDNHLLGQEFARILPKMQGGATLAQALTGIKHLDQVRLIPFVTTGEASGSLPEMLWRHVRGESEGIAHFQQQLAEWVPRILYGLVMAWMAYSLLTGGGVGPVMPEELR